MSNIQKIGANLEIKNIVLHQLLKESGNRIVQKRIANGILQVGEKEKVFLGNLDKAYHSKSNPIWGIFANENPNFHNLLKKYWSQEIEFFDFSVNIVDHYERVLQNTPQATGGYMILCEYKNTTTNKNLLLVLMINNKEGFVVNESDLTLENIKNLDLSKVDVACIINLTDWHKISNYEETSRKTYLSFVKGLKQISYYFMSFIDVDNKTTSAEATSRLLSALNDYGEFKNWSRENRVYKRNEVNSYCLTQMQNNRDIELTAISALVNIEEPNEFEEFAIQDKYKVSSIISGDKNKLKLLNTIKFEEKELKLEFGAQLLIEEKITYDEKTNKLTINDVSPILRSKILAINNGA